MRGAWLADLADVRETVRNLGNGSAPSENPPTPSRTPDGAETPRNERDPAEQNRSDEEIDSQVSAAEVDTFLRDVEDCTRRHAEDSDMLLEEINRRQGSEIVDLDRTPEKLSSGTARNGTAVTSLGQANF